MSANENQMDNVLFRKKYYPNIEKLLTIPLNNNTDRIRKNKLVPTLSQLRGNLSENNIDNAVQVLNEMEESLKVNNDESEFRYFADIDNARNLLSEFKDNYIESMTKFPTILKELEKNNNEIDRMLKEPDNRIAETVKRLGIGLIVGTLILSVLRFFSKLYQQNYNEVLNSQKDELQIRKTVVSFMATKDDPKGRRDVALAILNNAPAKVDIGKIREDEDIENKDDVNNNTLKTIMDYLFKKGNMS